MKDVCIESLGHVVTLPKNRNTKLLVTTAAKKVTSFRGQLALLKDEMISIAKQLSAYVIGSSMNYLQRLDKRCGF